MRLPHLETTTDVDAVIVGVPTDDAVSFRSGARFGPEAIRSASVLLRPYNPDLGVDVTETLSIVDYGDAPTVPGYHEPTLERVEEYLAPIHAASVVPVCLGGDHSIALAELRAAAKVHGRLALVHLDAHSDTWDSYFGASYFHGTVFRRAMEEGLIAPGASVQAGMRGTLYDASDEDQPRALGFDVIPWCEMRRMTPDEYAARVARRVGQMPVFLSFDVDFVDPAFAPGTGTPEVGGPSSYEALAFLRALRGLSICAADCVEVAPANALEEELFSFLRIPSISTSPANERGLDEAARWLRERFIAAGADVQFIPGRVAPLVVAELSSDAPAPRALIYGHYDVQGVDPPADWATPPFDPVVRGERIYARGSSDDKGNFLPLIWAACELARGRSLGLNMCILAEGEEEIGSPTALDWLSERALLFDCAIIFDVPMSETGVPALVTESHGYIEAHVDVRTGERDLHSGIHGGRAQNAAHALVRMLAAILPEASRRVRTAPPVHAGIGTTEHSQGSLDVEHVWSGAPRSIIPATARARIGVRIPPGQQAARAVADLELSLRAAAEPTASVGLDVDYCEAARFDPESPPLRLARKAIEQAVGMPPALAHTRASIPILAPLAKAGVPTVVTGFSLDEDNVHGVDESFLRRHLEVARVTARELLATFATLRAGARHRQ